MTNPYSVLGLSSSATEEQIKSTYRELVVKYSENEYTADPLNTVANSRMEELNSAFDQIMAERRAGGNQSFETPMQSPSYTNDKRSANNNDSTAQNYIEIRELIRSNDTLTAEQRLLSIDSSLRSAEWNYLMGCICQTKGWLDEAYRYFSAANSIDPRNTEYANSYNRMTRERTTGGSSYNPYQQQQRPTNGGCIDDSCCQCLCMYSLCSNCCCGH